MKEKIYAFDDIEDDYDMVRFRFKAWRQAHGLSRKDMKQKLGNGPDINKFETLGGNPRLLNIYRLIHELRVDPGFLMAGSYATVMPATRQRLEAILAHGRTLTDKEADQCLSNNGFEPIHSSSPND